LSLFNKLDIQKIRNNPKKSKELLEELIKNKIHGKIIEKVDYEFSSEIMISNSLQDNNGKCKKEIDYTLLGKYIYDGIPANNYLYDKAVGDSNVEKDIIEEGLEKVDNSKIVVYAKLPKISIPTPYKTYNPDFAYLIERENSKKIFLVVEAKGYNNESNISEEEQSKIEYAKIFFKKLQKELKDVDVVYKTRLNKEDLINLIK